MARRRYYQVRVERTVRQVSWLTISAVTPNGARCNAEDALEVGEDIDWETMETIDPGVVKQVAEEEP